MEDYEAIELIEAYAAEHPSFDTEFIDSVSEAYDQYGSLTDGQFEACERIIARFRMGQWEKDKANVSKPGDEPWIKN